MIQYHAFFCKYWLLVMYSLHDVLSKWLKCSLQLHYIRNLYLFLCATVVVDKDYRGSQIKYVFSVFSQFMCILFLLRKCL